MPGRVAVDAGADVVGVDAALHPAPGVAVPGGAGLEDDALEAVALDQSVPHPAPALGGVLLDQPHVPAGQLLDDPRRQLSAPVERLVTYVPPVDLQAVEDDEVPVLRMGLRPGGADQELGQENGVEALFDGPGVPQPAGAVRTAPRPGPGMTAVLIGCPVIAAPTRCGESR